MTISKASRLKGKSLQSGLSFALVLSLISALSLLTVLGSRVLQGKSNMQMQYAAQANAIDIQKSADALRTKLASLKLTYGSIDPAIENNQITSVSSIWSAMPLPANASQVALSPWTMTNADRFVAPFSNEQMRLANIDVNDRVCEALNQMQIRNEDPVISSTGNGIGGTNFTVSNPGFNSGNSADLFCVVGAGNDGASRVFLGIAV